ncbi:MAG: Crp/Fnr family transcriptional regulator [Pseudomonadota bacterium]
MSRPGFLDSMTPETRRTLLSRGARKVFEKDAVVFEQGLAGGSMLVIETGRVEITSIMESGRTVLLGHLGPGDLVGELTLLDRSPRSATVTAVRPVTGVLLTFEDMEGFLLEHPSAMFGILIDLASKLRAANALAETRALDDGSARLAGCLIGLAERWGKELESGQTRIEETFSQSILGQMAQLSRENVNRRIRAWSKDGMLGADGNKIIVQDMMALRRIAEASRDG